ncbi:hypothetical protein [Macrococcus sp. DPC7161]|uniref:hypothetical protein n=1 Tax=Macrococcus sp. DPC7161 TaxID=2507060 RepID=UPI00100AE2EC|nr:hypothetical protein [Macrococcus sp. DPC7161]RXK19033.1 hypothetical protein ER639_01600 [Macrococcus sp. DPC7161]
MKFLKLDLRLMKWMMVVLLISIIMAFLMKWASGGDNYSYITINTLSFSFADTFMIIFIIFTTNFYISIYAQKDQLKIDPFIKSLPYMKKEKLLYDISFVTLTHLIVILISVLYCSFYDEWYKLFSMIMIIGTQLIINVCSFYLNCYQKSKRTWLGVIGGILGFIIITFHFIGIVNDHFGKVDLSEYHFLLYQLPLVVIVLGFIMIVITYFYYKKIGFHLYKN